MKNKFGYRGIIWVVIFCLVLGAHELSWAKGKKLLLFAHDITFLPRIETILHDLRDYGTGDTIFSDITNLNTWSINRFELGQLDELVRFYESSPELRRKSKSALTTDSVLRERIMQSEAYIRIDVLPKGSLMEFQLIITDSLPKVEKNEFPTIVTEKSRYAGFVIDISREDYDYQLENSLKRLFPNSNCPPIPIVKLNTEKNEDSCYYFGVGRTAILDASESYDPDTPLGHLRFRWAQKNPIDEHKPVRENEIVPIDVSSKKQVLSFANKGEYHFGLTVSDGIADSKEEVIKIRVIDPPRFLLEPHYSFMSNYLSHNKLRIPFSVVVQNGETAHVSLLPASIRCKPSFPENIFYKPKTQTLESDRYEVKYLRTTTYSGIDTVNYELVVQGEAPSTVDYEYEFSIAAETDKSVSDTADVGVHYRSRKLCFNADLMNIVFIGKKDTVKIDKRIVAFRPSFRIYLHKEISLDFGLGRLIPLYKEDIVDSLDIFDTKLGSYVSFNTKYFSIPTYLSDGIGVRANLKEFQPILLPLSIEFMRYWRRDYYSISLSGSLELSSSWITTVWTAFTLFTWLSMLS